MPSPIYCSFYTVGTGYEAEARELSVTLNRFGLQQHVQGVPHRGSWEGNCAGKPSFLLDMRERYPGLPLVWLDADARVRRSPTLLDELDCDLAFHLKGGEELLSGTLYVGPTREAGDCLNEWNQECRRRPGEWDQRCLQAVVDRMGPYLRVAHLPASYVAIFDAGMCAEHEKVIEHMQASRRLKHWINTACGL